jgi:hypothetical protein
MKLNQQKSSQASSNISRMNLQEKADTKASPPKDSKSTYKMNQKDWNIIVKNTVQDRKFSSLIKNLNQNRHEKIKQYIDCSITCGFILFCIQVHQYLYIQDSVFQNRFSVLPQQLNIVQTDD